MGGNRQRAWPDALNYSRNSTLLIRDDAVTRVRQLRPFDNPWEGSMPLDHRYRRQLVDDPIRRKRSAIGLRDKFRHAVSTPADTVAETSGS
jgi:hypothetical protein